MVQVLLFMLVVHIGVNFTGYMLSGSQPAVTTTLAAGITASDTTVPVTGSGVAGFPGSGYLYIQGEAMRYTDTTESCPSPFTDSPSCFTGVSRGQLNTTPVSYQADTTVYNEATGTFNNLSNFETVTSVDELGESTNPLTLGKEWAKFFAHWVTWDWPMFEGNFAIFRVFGSAFSVATLAGAAIGLLGGARRLLPF